MKSNIRTLGQLKESGWKSISVKEEMRKNLIDRMKNSEELFPGIKGYENSVIPQLQHAILSKHDLILLGLRGQGKTKILRQLVDYLDEWMPIIDGSEINDDPFNPVSHYGKSKASEMCDETEIRWIHRSDRYGEKLATPDTTVADLIGDLDPIKAAANKLSLADEQIINFGLLPRTNRGIFVINELPDLQPRIQVALLNIMQERDIQIRGFNIRMPMDSFIAFSANPEDYTNRGNIITPLKDRIDAQIITHYPKTVETAMEITRQEARINTSDTLTIAIPDEFREIIEQVAFQARNSEYINQKSGVSTRLTITAMEMVFAAAERRALINGEDKTIVRVSDLYHMVPSLTGKMELVYEGEQEGAVNVARHLIGKAVNTVFKSCFADPRKKNESEDSIYTDLLKWFSNGNKLELTDTMGDSNYQDALKSVNGLDVVLKSYQYDNVYQYSLMDLILEGLHQNSMLGKEHVDQSYHFGDMLGSMLGDLGRFDEDDEDDQNESYE